MSTIKPNWVVKPPSTTASTAKDNIVNKQELPRLAVVPREEPQVKTPSKASVEELPLEDTPTKFHLEEEPSATPVEEVKQSTSGEKTFQQIFNEQKEKTLNASTKWEACAEKIRALDRDMFQQKTTGFDLIQTLYVERDKLFELILLSKDEEIKSLKTKLPSE
jgi:hypothetical protein